MEKGKGLLVTGVHTPREAQSIQTTGIKVRFGNVQGCFQVLLPGEWEDAHPQPRLLVERALSVCTHIATGGDPIASGTHHVVLHGAAPPARARAGGIAHHQQPALLQDVRAGPVGCTRPERSVTGTKGTPARKEVVVHTRCYPDSVFLAPITSLVSVT